MIELLLLGVGSLFLAVLFPLTVLMLPNPMSVLAAAAYFSGWIWAFRRGSRPWTATDLNHSIVWGLGILLCIAGANAMGTATAFEVFPNAAPGDPADVFWVQQAGFLAGFVIFVAMCLMRRFRGPGPMVLRPGWITALWIALCTAASARLLWLFHHDYTEPLQELGAGYPDTLGHPFYVHLQLAMVWSAVGLASCILYAGFEWLSQGSASLDPLEVG